MDLNHIFLFLALISPLLVLARTLRPGGPHRGWRIAALIVLGVTALTWICAPRIAGYAGGLAWMFLLFLPAIGLRKVTEFAERGDYRAARILGTILQPLHPSDGLRRQLQLFRHLESEAAKRPRAVFARLPHGQVQKLRRAPAVMTLILLNIAAFVFEISAGDWTDPGVLRRVGALDPYAVVERGEYWRLFSALFLHGGIAHLGFNLFALYVLGPPLERAIGSLRFVICYVISGLASSAGVVALTVLGLVDVDLLVGASGCIMGVVGAWAGFWIRHRSAPQARQQIGNVLLIVAIQTAFDLSTPQVSLSAHVGGLIAGFFLGLILAPTRQVKSTEHRNG